MQARATPKSARSARSYASSPAYSPLASQDTTERAQLLHKSSPLNEKGLNDPDDSFQNEAEGDDSGLIEGESQDSAVFDDARPPPAQPLFARPIGPRRLHPLALLPAFFAGLVIAYVAAHFPSLPAWISDQPLATTVTHHESGLVFLDPTGYIRAEETDKTRSTAEHPILGLMREAEQQWHDKHQRRSKSLEEAVVEYRRRYGRAPPKGFDRWYKWAIERGVVFHDEYDGMNRNLEPYWAVPPAVLRERAVRLENEHDGHIARTFTFHIRNGNLTISSIMEHGRVTEHAAFCNDFIPLLEDVSLTFSFEDGPRVQLDYEARQRHVAAAREGRLLTAAELEDVNNDWAWRGWELACAPDSRLRRAANGLEYGQLPMGIGFVGNNHVEAMDVCSNPEWKGMHGYTYTQGLRPQTLEPVASFSKLAVDSDILIPALEQYWDTSPTNADWKDKPHNKAAWRGSTTGLQYNRTTPWRSSQRPRLLSLANDTTGSRRVRFTDENGRIVEQVLGHKELSERYLNVGFTGKLLQCNEDCELLKKEFNFNTTYLLWEEQSDHKYLIDVDGNGWSGRFHRLMTSKSLVLKSTIFAPWYSETIQPWYHYAPLRVDYSDLYDILGFFSGDLEGKGNHDELAEIIGARGAKWAAEHFRLDDMKAYMFRLYLELARILSDDRSSMDYVG